MKKIYLLILTCLLTIHSIEAKNDVVKYTFQKSATWNPNLYNQLIRVKLATKNIKSYEYKIDINVPMSISNLKWLKNQKNNRFISKNSELDNRFQNIHLNANTILARNKMISINKELKIQL